MADLSGLFFHIDKSDICGSGELGYTFEGWLLQDDSDLKDLRVLGDGSAEIPSESEFYDRTDVKAAFHELKVQDKPGFAVNVKNIDRYILKYGKVGLYVFYGGEKKLLDEIQSEYILPFITEKSAEYRVEKVEIAQDRIRITGWAVNRFKKQAADISLADMDWKRVDTYIETFPRPDVNEYLSIPADEMPCAGFEVRARYKDYREAKLCLRMRFDINAYKDHIIDLTDMYRSDPPRSSVKRFNENKLLQFRFIKKYGRDAYRKYVSYLDSEKDCAEYMMWNILNGCGEKKLREQRKYDFKLNPLISVVMPLYNTPEDYLEAAIRSIQAQSYGNFELCLADGSSEDSVGRKVMEICGGDSRIKYIRLESNSGISGNTNEAIKAAKGEYIVFADHDDTVAPDALYEIVSLINRTEGAAELIYSSEDKLSPDGEYIFDPVSKPAFNPDFLRCQNYMCHIVAVKRGLLEKAGSLRPEYDGAQDHDFLLRCMEHTKEVYYIPKPLYHWRQHSGSASSDVKSGGTAKAYAYDAGKRAVKDHYARLGYDASVSDTEIVGIYHSALKPKGDPKVSAVILNADGCASERCADSVRKSGYENIEIIVKERGGNTAETLNGAVSEAAGDYILIIDGGAETVSLGCVEEMLGYCAREDTAIVGAKIYDENGNAVNMGFVLGENMLPKPAKIDENARYPLNYIVRDMYAVSTSCVMIKKSFFEESGGFDSKLAGELMAADICMKARRSGYLTVFDPFTKARCFAGSEAQRADEGQAMYFKEKWADGLSHGDPYYVDMPDLSKIDFAEPEIF